jgi:hypothetical protein
MVKMVVICILPIPLKLFIPMKAYELLSSPETWCQSSPARDHQGNKLQAFDPRAAQWCALGAIQKTYPPTSWAAAMDRVLSALSYSDAGLAQMTPNDKACSLMEWNDNHQSSFQEIREILLNANI